MKSTWVVKASLKCPRWYLELWASILILSPTNNLSKLPTKSMKKKIRTNRNRTINMELDRETIDINDGTIYLRS